MPSFLIPEGWNDLSFFPPTSYKVHFSLIYVYIIIFISLLSSCFHGFNIKFMLTFLEATVKMENTTLINQISLLMHALWKHLLTLPSQRDRMYQLISRAYSSMVEQWPFKPFVLGSSPSTLTYSGRALLSEEGIFYL